MKPAKMRSIAPPPTSSVRRAVREELLAAAGALMTERDTLEISLVEIGERAGANTAMVKYYFGNKEGLLVALLERDAQHTLEQLLRLLAMDLDPAEKMRRHLKGMLKTYFQRPYINRLLLLVLHNQTPERRQEIADRFTRPLTEAYRQLIDEGVAAGLFRQLDPMFLYFQAVGICEQLFSAHILLPTIYGVEALDRVGQGRFIEQTIDIFMAGIRRASPRDEAASSHAPARPD